MKQLLFPLTVEDRLLIKALCIERGWNVNRMIAEFPARQWKQCTLFDLVNKTDSTGSCFSGAPSHRWKLMVGWRKRFTLHGADRLAIEHARPEPCGLFDLVCLQQLVYTVKN